MSGSVIIMVKLGNCVTSHLETRNTALDSFKNKFKNFEVFPSEYF